MSEQSLSPASMDGTRRGRGLRGLPPLVWLLGFASLMNDVSSETIFPLLPVFLAGLGASLETLGLIEGAADALGSLVKVLAGRISDRGARRLLVVGGYSLPALARAGIAVALAPWHVLVARLVDRAGKGIRSGPRDAMLADSVPSGDRGRAFGLQRGMDHLGAAVGPVLAAALLAWGVRLRTVFLIAACLGLMAPVLLVLRLRDRRASRAAPAAQVAPGQARPGAVRLAPAFWRYLAVCSVFALGNSSDAFLIVRAREVGWGVAAIPLLWLVHHAVKTVVAVPGGALSDRMSRRKLVAAGWGAYALTYTGFAFAGGRWTVAVLFVAYALYHGLVEGAERALVADLAGQGSRGRAYGWYHGAVGMVALPAGLATGAIWQRWGARPALLANAGCAAVACIALLVVKLGNRAQETAV